MDNNMANNLSILTKKILICCAVLILFSCSAYARITFEAVTADSATIYSGDTLSASPLIIVTINTNLNLLATNPIILNISGSTTSLTPSSYSAGTITAQHQPTLTDGIYNIRVSATDITNNTRTWEATNLIVDSASQTTTISDPLNFPNPCNADTGTAIGYKLSKQANITLTIHDLLGNLISKKSYAAGSNGGLASYNEVTWDCKTDSGNTVGNGIYIYLIVGDGKLLSRGRIAVIK